MAFSQVISCEHLKPRVQFMWPRRYVRIDNSAWWTIYNVKLRPYYFNEYTGITQWEIPYQDVWPHKHDDLPKTLLKKRIEVLCKWLNLGSDNCPIDAYRIVDERNGVHLIGQGGNSKATIWKPNCANVLIGDWEDRCKAFALITGRCVSCYLHGELVGIPYGDIKCLSH